jgi:hypothetical protein
MPIYERPDKPQFTVDQFDAVVPVVPSDTEDLEEGKTSALWVGTGGNVKVDCLRPDGARTTATLPNVRDGSCLPGRIIRVWLTGTTASNMVALY